MKQLNKKRSKDMEQKLYNYVKELKKACELVDTIREDIYQDLKDWLFDENGRLVEIALDEAGYDIDMAIKALEKKIKKL